jgi:glycosyltransferase involved in cell wall biosynthesis
MYRTRRVAVVVPAYNEETQIGRVIDTMPDFVDRIIVVDDCSRDHTGDVVKAHPAFAKGRVDLIVHAANQGVGGAIASGYVRARDEGYDIAVVMAGDGQMDPADLPALLDPLVEDLADYSKGNRLVTGDAIRKIPRVRFVGNAILSLLTKVASGYWTVADSQTGYTAINARALAAIDWSKMYRSYGQPNDVLVRLNVEGFRVGDVPVAPVYNVGEVSGIKIRRVIFTIGALLVRLFLWRLKEKYIIRSFHPLVFFYLVSFLFLMISGGLAVRLVSLWIGWGGVPELTFVSLLFSLGMSFNALCFAMWFDYEANRHLSIPLIHRDVRR